MRPTTDTLTATNAHPAAPLPPPDILWGRCVIMPIAGCLSSPLALFVNYPQQSIRPFAHTTVPPSLSLRWPPPQGFYVALGDIPPSFFDPIYAPLWPGAAPEGGRKSHQLPPLHTHTVGLRVSLAGK